MDGTLPANLAEDFTPVLRQRYGPYRAHLPVRTYEHCFVTHSGIGLKRFRLIKESVFDELAPKVTRHLHRYAVYKYLTEPRVALDHPNLCLLHNHWSTGYHHWLAECLVKLRTIQSDQYVVIVPRSLPRFATESLELFSFGGVAHVDAGRSVRAARLTVVANPYTARYNPADIVWLREYILARCGPAEVPTGRIYVTRRGERTRRVENEDEVVALLDQYGFRAIDPARLSFGAQARLFASCRALVSIHGAGLTNCMFMPWGARVLELYRELSTSEPTMNPCYWKLCEAAGLQYYYQFCDHGRNEGDVSDHVNVIVDVDKLERNVTLMLEG
jgi:capsular polysaccharide biosynthesis protein